MAPKDGDAVAGVCHARGGNANVPPVWLIYVTVESVEASIEACVTKGGAVVHGPRNVSGKPCAIIRDPAGAMMAIIEG